MNKIRESIFLKLVLVFLLAGVLSVGVFVTFKYCAFQGSRFRETRAKHWVQYSQMLVEKMGPAPDEKEIQDLAHRWNLWIRVEQSGKSMASGPHVPSLQEVENGTDFFYNGEGFRFGPYKNHLVAEIFSAGSTRFLFLIQKDAYSLEEHPEMLFAPALFILLLFFGTYLVIRRILRPLVSLEKGVTEVTKGNLNVVIPGESQDELGRLVQSFNKMTEQVRMMIQSKEQLLLDVSHEFRSPLTRIKVALEINDPDAQRSIKSSVHELETMVSELLESARLNDAQGKLKLERLDLVELLSDLIPHYVKSAPGILMRASDGPIYCKADHSRLYMVFKNLIENAFKYSANQTRPVEIQVRSLDASVVRVIVKDYGIGIPKEDLPLIFEPFYRVDRSRVRTTGGYGLGLSLCKKIIAAHEGQITVESEVGQGASFIVDLKV